jgi:hypothetical protein
LKLYLVQWGFYSCLDGGSELDSIWTNKENAKKYIKEQAEKKDLEPHKKHPSDDYFTDGDYYIHLTEVDSDTENMYG